MVDDPAHLSLIEKLRAARRERRRVAIDIDAGLRLGRSHVGPKRSPLYDAARGRRLRPGGGRPRTHRWSG